MLALKHFYLTALIWGVLLADISYSQIRIAPPSITLDDRTPTGRFIVHNGSYTAVEVEVDLLYGYQHTNEEGKPFFMRYEDAPDGDDHSALDWVRIYPRHFILQPGEQQFVRMAARPPAGLPQGEYWVRPVFVTQEPMQYHADAGETEAISARVNLRRRDVLSVTYRRGTVNTAISISELTAEKKEGKIIVKANLERGGNAAYRGGARIQVFNERGDKVAGNGVGLTVFKSQVRAFEIAADELPSGNYSVELDISTEFTSGNLVIPSEPAHYKTTFFIP